MFFHGITNKRHQQCKAFDLLFSGWLVKCKWGWEGYPHLCMGVTIERQQRENSYKETSPTVLGITSHLGLLHCVEHNRAVTKKHPRDWERRKITLSNLEGSCLGICFGKEKVDLLCFIVGCAELPR